MVWFVLMMLLAGFVKCSMYFCPSFVPRCRKPLLLPTTADINRILYRQFGRRIHRETVSWNGETINLRESVVRQLRNNYLESRGIVKRGAIHSPRAAQPRQSPSAENKPASRVPDSHAGAKDANREYEVGNGMSVNDVDDEQSQQSKWRR